MSDLLIDWKKLHLELSAPPEIERLRVEVRKQWLDHINEKLPKCYKFYHEKHGKAILFYKDRAELKESIVRYTVENILCLAEVLGVDEDCFNLPWPGSRMILGKDLPVRCRFAIEVLHSYLLHGPSNETTKQHFCLSRDEPRAWEYMGDLVPCRHGKIGAPDCTPLCKPLLRRDATYTYVPLEQDFVYKNNYNR